MNISLKGKFGYPTLQFIVARELRCIKICKAQESAIGCVINQVCDDTSTIQMVKLQGVFVIVSFQLLVVTHAIRPFHN